MGNPADIAMQKLSEFFANDPALRGVLHPDLPTPRPGGVIKPATDIVTGEDRVAITIEVPGLSKQDLHIVAEGDRLRVWGELKARGTHPGKRTLKERRYGKFKREFSIPNAVDRDGIEASLEDGLLTLTLPLKPDKGKRVIDVV